MGNISSRPEDGSSIFLKDQTRLSVASVAITNARRKVLLNIVPNAFPASRLSARRDIGDDSPVEYIQDPDALLASQTTGSSFILRLSNDEELNFRFSFIIRQTTAGSSASSNLGEQSNHDTADTSIAGLTFAYASTPRDLDNLVTREFHADPNLHKNSNVQLVGDYSTDGSPAVQFEWSWKWKPPRPSEDKGGGWRNTCSFLEYDQRAHRLNTLATFSFWVQNTQRLIQNTPVSSPGIELSVPPRLRVPSSQSYQSRISDSEAVMDAQEPPSPPDLATEPGSSLSSTLTNNSFKLDVACARPGEDMSAVEDGPVFRATVKALEQKTGSMRTRMKKVLKKAEAAQLAQVESNQAIKAFMAALQEASSSNASAIKPALDHYFNQIAQQILNYETQNSTQLQKLIIDPLSKLYNLDIKQAEAKKKDFEDESRDYYAYVSRYLGQRQDSLKEKKRAESDSKYQTKRRNFELKRFDYSSFMQDLHGGRKEQEMLSQLTKFADSQAKSFLATAKKIEEMSPQLDALIREVGEADKEFRFQRTEREEKRRVLEKSTTSYTEPDTSTQSFAHTASAGLSSQAITSAEADIWRADSTGSQLRNGGSVKSSAMASPNQNSLNTLPNPSLSASPNALAASPGSNRFKGIRDLEERESIGTISELSSAEQKKEGLLWALSRPGSHIDPKGINKQAWHKFWIVLDQGKLSEYSNWKQKLDLHMEPIDLRMASVRVARDAERRFCFEVITPQFKRVYQATSEEDMSNWIKAINNALQSAVENGSSPPASLPLRGVSPGRDLGSVLTGKSSSVSGHHGYSSRHDQSQVNRRTTVGARPSYVRTNSNSYEENPSKLLQQIRDVDQGNSWCADCSSGLKVEWVSINLGIILCIECSGIHRSLGTHISKVRSLTLDIHSFSNDIVELLLQIGNRVSNMVWEASLDHSTKPGANSSREQRLRFITAKYSERAYVQPISSRPSHYSSADEALLASVKKNDICGVLYAIALHGNVNATDRSRGTHAVFLALAAADPAAPGGSPSISPNGKSATAPPKMVAFPMAELLVQNGAEIPLQLPAIPLSPAAKLYVEQRALRGGGATSGQDTVGALPTIRNVGGGHGFAGPMEKEREAKLQKRGSAGGRFAGKMAALGADR